MLHPFVPFIAEEIWQTLGDNLHSPAIMAEWPALPDALIDDQLERDEEVVHGVISTIRNARQQYGVKPGDKIAVILKVEDNRLAAMLRNEAPTLDRLANVAELTVAADPEVPKPAATGFVGDVGVFVPLADLIDIDTERTRLEKELEKARGHLQGTQKKLENSKFVDKAPAEVVAQARERLSELEELTGKLQASLAELG